MALHFSRRDFLPAGLKADQIELVENTIRIHSHSAKTAAACPHCGTISRHVHSRYRHRPADLPAHGRAVELVLLVRRFRCRAMNCSAKIFAERFPPAVTRPYARRTSRLQGLVRHLGLALGGRPAQALAARLQLPASKDTFLRSIRSTAKAASSELRVIGIDDWAWRNGQRYGTLICDLERRRVIDLLPDREPATVEAWLRARPGIEVVARDRNGGYGSAVSRALPKAVHPLVVCRANHCRTTGCRPLAPVGMRRGPWPQCGRVSPEACEGGGKAAIRGLPVSPADQSNGSPDGR